MPVPTNLLALPLVSMDVETGTNEDWIDSIKFVVEDGSENPPQLDLTGIKFEMEIRRAAPNHEVVLGATTDDGSLTIGTDPDYGFLIINIDHEKMQTQQPGKYVADIIGSDDESVRRCIIIDLTIVQGITRP